MVPLPWGLDEVSMESLLVDPPFESMELMPAEKAWPAATQALKSKVRSHSELAMKFFVALPPDPLSVKIAAEEGGAGVPAGGVADGAPVAAVAVSVHWQDAETTISYFPEAIAGVVPAPFG